MASPFVMDCSRFIQEVSERPEIWMMKHPDRKNKFRVKRQWDEIRKKYPEFTVDELKKRWKNLKDTYRKELKRLPQSRPGVPADNFRSCWRYFESLSFLRDELTFPGRDAEENNSTQEPEKYVEASSQSPASPASSKSEDEAVEPAGPKRRDPREVREEFLRIEKKKMKILEDEIARSNQYMKSDNYHFLMSLLPEMDKLPPLQKMRLRTKISQAVLDEVSLAMYDDQTNYSEVQQIHFQEAAAAESANVIKEEAINMYD